MKVSYNWLNFYFDKKLPDSEDVAKALTTHSYEVEGTEQIGDDTVIEIDVLPNRSSDSLSHLGVARELAVVLDLPIINDPTKMINFEGDSNVKNDFTLTVEDANLVRRATKRRVEGVQVGESHGWIKDFLETLGHRSINNVVDITNFVMLETGQPVHAFDADKIEGNITIRKARAGEKITTLDGDEFSLDENVLVIADDKKALDIAGVKGGASSGIDENTKNVILSVCSFNPTNIRKTSRGLKLLTDASKRFEQDITPEQVEVAMNRLSAMISEYAGGRVAAEFLDEYPKKAARYVGGFSTAHANKVLGTSLSDGEVESILDRFKNHAGFEWEKVTPVDRVLELAKSLEGKPYKYGSSVSYDAPECFDCSSFTAYVFSRAGIGLPRMTADQLIFTKRTEEKDLKPGNLVFSLNAKSDIEKFENVASGEEIEQVSVHGVSREFLPGTAISGGVDHCGIYLGDGKIIHASGNWHKGEVVIEDLNESVAFQNVVGYGSVPHLSDERYFVTVPYERLDLRATRSFYAGGNAEDLIEEIGRIYGLDNIEPQMPTEILKPEVNKVFYYQIKVREILTDLGFSELYNYTFTGEGEEGKDLELLNPLDKTRSFLRNNLSTVFKEKLEMNVKNLDLLGTDQILAFEFGKVFTGDSEQTNLVIGAITKKGLDDKKNKQVLDEAIVTIEESLSVSLGGNTEVNFEELVKDLELPESYGDLPASPDMKYRSFSQYPHISRDIAMWVPAGTDVNEVENTLKENAGDLVVGIRQFDRFEKEGRVSYAYRIVFQSKEKTLTDEEVNSFMDKVYKEVESKGWEVR